MSEETKTVKITCGAVGTLVSLAGCHLPMVLAEAVNLEALDDLDVFYEVPIYWVNLDGDLRTAEIDVRLLVDWTPPERRNPNQEMIEFIKEMMERFGPPKGADPAPTGADPDPTLWMWRENAPGSEPEALHVPASGESVARTKTVPDDPAVQCAMAAAAGDRVASEPQSFTSDDPRAPWNQTRA